MTGHNYVTPSKYISMWDGKFGSLLDLVQGYILDVWELRKSQHSTVPVSDCARGTAGEGSQLRLQDTGMGMLSSIVCFLGYVCVLCVHFPLAPPILQGVVLDLVLRVPLTIITHN